MELLHDHIDYVARTLARIGVRGPDIEDLTQEVLIVAVRRVHTFDTERRVEPWLFGIARNVARDYWRLARHRVEKVGAAELSMNDAHTQSPAAAAELGQRAHLLRAAVAELDDTLQELVVLHDLEEIPMADVADALGIKIDTAYARLRRARAEVRSRLAKTGGGRGIN